MQSPRLPLQTTGESGGSVHYTVSLPNAAHRGLVLECATLCPPYLEDIDFLFGVLWELLLVTFGPFWFPLEGNLEMGSCVAVLHSGNNQSLMSQDVAVMKSQYGPGL